MSVYVDDMKIPFGRFVMCHMLADTVDELHEMADRIGIPRDHFQPKSAPHYDLSKSKRRLAIIEGAIEIDKYKVVEIIKQYREGR